VEVLPISTCERLNLRTIVRGERYCCLLPRCEALRTCRSGFSDLNTSSANVSCFASSRLVLLLICFIFMSCRAPGTEAKNCNGTKGFVDKSPSVLIFVNVSNEKTFFLACDFFTAISLSRSLSIA